MDVGKPSRKAKTGMMVISVISAIEGWIGTEG